MGQKQSSVQIANAHPNTVWVKVRSERFTCYKKSKNVESGVEVDTGSPVDAGISGSASGGTLCRAEYAVQIDEGYLAVPPLGVTTFRPAPNFTQTVYVSAFRRDAAGGEVRIALDAPHAENCALIITSMDGIVDSRTQESPWVDMNGTNHYNLRIAERDEKRRDLMEGIANQFTKLEVDVKWLQSLVDGEKAKEVVANVAEQINELRMTASEFSRQQEKSVVL